MRITRRKIRGKKREKTVTAAIIWAALIKRQLADASNITKEEPQHYKHFTRKLRYHLSNSAVIPRHVQTTKQQQTHHVICAPNNRKSISWNNRYNFFSLIFFTEEYTGHLAKAELHFKNTYGIPRGIRWIFRRSPLYF